MKKILSILFLISYVNCSAFMGGGEREPDQAEIHSFKIVEHKKHVEVPIFVDKIINVPKINYVVEDIIKPNIIEKDFLVKNINIKEVEKIVKIPKIVYEEQKVAMPTLDPEELKSFIKERIDTALKEVGIENIIRTAVNDATENITIKNAIIENVPVKNVEIIEIKKTVEVPVYKEVNFIKPVLREQVIRVKKIIGPNGEEWVG